MIDDIIETSLTTHLQTVQATVGGSKALIQTLSDLICGCFGSGGKVMLCGNGGSAADAQHVAGEFINRFRFDRRSLPGMALSTDTSVLTAIGNDSSFDNIFSRQVEALGHPGDVLIVFSTSGGSPNVLRALEAAQNLGITTVGFTGIKGQEKMASRCDYCLVVPSSDTPRIQECHIFVAHILCELVEAKIFECNPSV